MYALIELQMEYGYYIVMDIWGTLIGYRCMYCVRLFDNERGVKSHMGYHNHVMGCEVNVKRPVLIRDTQTKMEVFE